MIKILVLAVLTLSYDVFAQDAVTKFSHWLPPIQSNLYEEIQKEQDSQFDTPSEIKKENKNAISLLNKKTSKKTVRAKYITQSEADNLVYRLKNDPVVRSSENKNYDPNGRYGFCFGRATWVWLNALEAGMDKDSIKKIFLVGPMRASNLDWQFHVATAIRSKGFFSDTWLVIDSTFDRAITVEQFLNFYGQFNANEKLRLIVTDPQRLVPSSTDKFKPMDYRNFENDYLYNRYFQDLLRNFSNSVNFKLTKMCKYLF